MSSQEALRGKKKKEREKKKKKKSSHYPPASATGSRGPLDRPAEGLAGLRGLKKAGRSLQPYYLHVPKFGVKLSLNKIPLKVPNPSYTLFPRGIKKKSQRSELAQSDLTGEHIPELSFSCIGEVCAKDNDGERSYENACEHCCCPHEVALCGVWLMSSEGRSCAEYGP